MPIMCLGDSVFPFIVKLKDEMARVQTATSALVSQHLVCLASCQKFEKSERSKIRGTSNKQRGEKEGVTQVTAGGQDIVGWGGRKDGQMVSDHHLSVCGCLRVAC